MFVCVYVRVNVCEWIVLANLWYLRCLVLASILVAHPVLLCMSTIIIIVCIIDTCFATCLLTILMHYYHRHCLSLRACLKLFVVV